MKDTHTHTHTHTHREAETQAEGEAGSMQGAPCGTPSQTLLMACGNVSSRLLPSPPLTTTHS